MADVSRWLAAARSQNGLLIPGHPHRRACDLLLTAAGVQVSAEDEAAVLDWAEWSEAEMPDEPTGIGINRLAGEAWRVGSWSHSNNSSAGAALLVSGANVQATEGVRRRRRTLWSRFERLLDTGTAVPLFTQQISGSAGEADVGTVNTLCGLLRQRPRWRARLDEPERVERLARDLTARRYGVVPRRSGIRRSTLLVLNAMHALGHEHRCGGRPLPGDTIPELDLLVPRVLDRVHADPYAVGARVEAADVRGVLEHFYTGVEPWPFAALADD